jgi:hypothetical protein
MNQPLTGLAATLLILALVFSVSCEPIAPQQPGNSQPPTTGEIADPSLSLRLEPAFASTELLPGFIGPTLAILNNLTMRPAKALPRGQCHHHRICNAVPAEGIDLPERLHGSATP